MSSELRLPFRARIGRASDLAAIESTFDRARTGEWAVRLAARDTSLWSSDAAVQEKIANRPERSHGFRYRGQYQEQVPEMLEIAREGAGPLLLPFTRACVPVVDVAGLLDWSGLLKATWV